MSIFVKPGLAPDPFKTWPAQSPQGTQSPE